MPTKKTTKASTKKVKDSEEVPKPQETESKDLKDDLKPKKEKAPANVARNLLSEFDNEAVAEAEEEEVHTQEIVVKGKSYLVDQENNVYSVDTHEQIGTFEPATQTIV